ncbi:unnamed protein product, partial [Notodromas monacha]
METVSGQEIAFGLAGLAALAYATSTYRSSRRRDPHSVVGGTIVMHHRRSTVGYEGQDDVTRRRTTDEFSGPVPIRPHGGVNPDLETDDSTWDPYVRNRVQTTFAYLGSTAVITGMSTILACSSPKLASMCYGWEPVAFFGGMFVAFLSTSVVVLIPYESSPKGPLGFRFGMKQVAWLLNCVLSGIALTPLCSSPKLASMCYGWEPVAFFGGMFVAFLSTSVVVLIPYESSPKGPLGFRFGMKQVAWLLNCVLSGIALTPLCRFARASLIRSAILTAGTVGMLSAVGMMVSSESVLMISGPMAITFGAAVASAMGLSVYPVGTDVGNMLSDMNMNVVTVLFSLTLLYDIHNLVKEAETLRPDFAVDRDGIVPFDPVRHAVALFNSVLGIFIRILFAVVQSDSERRRQRELSRRQSRTTHSHRIVVEESESRNVSAYSRSVRRPAGVSSRNEMYSSCREVRVCGGVLEECDADTVETYRLRLKAYFRPPAIIMDASVPFYARLCALFALKMRFKTALAKRAKHSELVSGVAWVTTDDVLSCGDDHKLLKWNLVNSETTKVADFPVEVFPTCIQITPKLAGAGKGGDLCLVTGAEGKFYLMSLSGRIERSVEAHRGAVLCGRWSHDGAGVVTGGEDGLVKIWSRSGMLRSTLAQGMNPAYGVAWSPNSDAVLYTSGKSLVIKPLQPNSKPLQWRGHDGLILAVDWSPLNGCILSGGEDTRYRLWDNFGRMLFNSAAHDYPITSLSWSPDGELFAVGSFNTLRLCDKAGWSHSLEKPNSGSVLCLASSPL